MYVCVCIGKGDESVCDSYLLMRQEVFDNFCFCCCCGGGFSCEKTFSVYWCVVRICASMCFRVREISIR